MDLDELTTVDVNNTVGFEKLTPILHYAASDNTIGFEQLTPILQYMASDNTTCYKDYFWQLLLGLQHPF